MNRKSFLKNSHINGKYYHHELVTGSNQEGYLHVENELPMMYSLIQTYLQFLYINRRDSALFPSTAAVAY